MKKSELFFSALQVPVDYIMIVLAGLAAFFLRTTEEVSDIIQPIPVVFPLREYVPLLLATAAGFVVVYAIDGLYNIRSTKRTLMEVYHVFRATTIGIMIIMIGFFINRDIYSSRFVIIVGGVLIIAFVSLARIGLGYMQRYLMTTRGIGVHRVLLIGIGGICCAFRRSIEQNKDLGYKLVGHLNDIDMERLRRIQKLKGIDEVIECDPSVNKSLLLSLKDYCIHNKISFKYVPTVLQTANFDMSIFLGEPIIEIRNTPLDGWGKILKRAFDIFGAVVGIILFGIPMLVIALILWLESGWPVIFRNERVGHKGIFDLFKFRYMKRKYCHGKQFSEEHNKQALEFLQKLIEERSTKEGPVYKIKDDPRKTRFGTYLERFSLDELPQFFNVLAGNMSLVGPRPHQPIEVEKYEEHQKRVLTIKPGVTGMAQISGRSDLEFKDEVRLDTYYIENWSLWLDIQIIAKTFLTLWRRRRN